MMWVSKIPNYDAYGLFRALHSHNPFYAPLRSVLNMCHWHIAPLASYYSILTQTTSVKKQKNYNICKNSPLLNFGSNHVDFGGISMPASATANSSSPLYSNTA